METKRPSSKKLRKAFAFSSFLPTFAPQNKTHIMEHTHIAIKKAYQPPSTKVGMMVGNELFLAASQGGVNTGAAVGDAYTNSDVTYSRGSNSFWDVEE